MSCKLHSSGITVMTWQEFQSELQKTPLELMDLGQLARLSAFSLSEPRLAEDVDRMDQAKRHIRDEIARRNAKSERLDEASFRRQERNRADRQHHEYAALSGRMHVAQMEQAHARFVFHRRVIWIAAAIAVVSALAAWASLWRQREETQEALNGLMKRLEALEARHEKIGGQAPPVR